MRYQFPLGNRPSAFNAPLAQLVEQVTLNHWVAGSIPARCNFFQTSLIAEAVNQFDQLCDCLFRVSTAGFNNGDIPAAKIRAQDLHDTGG